MKIRIKKNSKPFRIIKYLALGAGVLTLSLTSPFIVPAAAKSIINQYIRKKKFEKYRFLRDLKNLQKREIIDYRELDNGQIEIKLAVNDKIKVLRSELNKIKIKKPARWDGKWRLVIFDIPHNLKSGRDALRRQLLDLNFYPIQKSVFITPYPCEEEIDFIASVFEIRKYILIFYVVSFEGEEKLKNYFKL